MGMNFPDFFSTGDTVVTLSVPTVNGNVFEPDADFLLHW